MRIAMMGQKHVPSREGGVELVVSRLSAGMAGLGHAVTCFNRAGGSGAVEWKGVQLRSVPTLNKRGLAAVTSSFFAAFPCAFGRYDVVHIHAEGPAFMAWLPRMMGKRVIVTVHGLDHQRAKWGRFAGWYILQGEKNAVRFAQEIIVLSKSVQDYFRRTYGRETVLIPNGVSRPRSMEADLIRTKYGLEKDDYILFLARMVPEKGLSYLIEAFRGIKTDKKLMIAGGSSDTDAYVEKMKRLAAGDERIRFVGFVEGKLLQELYSNAYLYCLPSDLEGMPLSLLEAMSYGNCCLTSDIPECTEVTGDHAVTFRKGDIKDLTRKLQMFLDDPQNVSFYREAAADFICKRYRWEDVIERTAMLYAGDSDGSRRR